MSSLAPHTAAVSSTKQALLRHETPTRSASQRQSALARANAIRDRRIRAEALEFGTLKQVTKKTA